MLLLVKNLSEGKKKGCRIRVQTVAKSENLERTGEVAEGETREEYHVYFLIRLFPEGPGQGRGLVFLESGRSHSQLERSIRVKEIEFS